MAVAVGIGILGILTFKKEVHALAPAIHTRVSVNNTGNGQGGNSYTPGGQGDTSQISANGRYVVFTSQASNLVANDTNNKFDVFLRDLELGTTVRVSTSASGIQSDGDSGTGNTAGIAISESGRYIAFSSRAINLIDGTTIGGFQVYLKDMKNNTIKIVTELADGTLGSGVGAFPTNVSNDGRFVLWTGGKNIALLNQGNANSLGYHLYLTDMKDKTIQLLSPRDGSSTNKSSPDVAGMSCDGSLIVTDSIDQLTTDDTDAVSDIYLIDIRNGFVIKNLTSISDLAATQPSLSCNGNYVTFMSKDYIFDSRVSTSNTKSHVYLYDRIDESYSVIDVTAGGVFSIGDSYGMAGVDDTGNVVYSGANSVLAFGSNSSQMFLKHKSNGVLELLTEDAYGNSAASLGTHQRVSISSNGKRAVYAVGPPASSLFIPPTGGIGQQYTYDSNSQGDVIMSLTGL